MSEVRDLTVDIRQSIEINSSMEVAWDALMRRIGSENATPDNQPMPMVLEQWPGGRWFRDLGDDQGHLWGFVQVIKPPKLIEITGPMFMSYAVSGHLQLRLTETETGCEMTLRHRVLGLVQDDHRAGVTRGWEALMKGVQQFAENGAG